MGPRKFGFAPGGNNGDKYGISDVNRREYRDMVMQEQHAKLEEARAKADAENTEKNIELNGTVSDKPKVVDYVDITIEKRRQLMDKEKEAKRAESLEAQRLAREKYYKEQHDLREERAKHEGLVSEAAERNEYDRKIELRHQFNHIKVETDTYLKMQAGLGLMSEKEIRDYRDNLKKQEENALNYMRDGGEGGFVPMENLMKNSLDQLEVFRSNIASTPEYQEMIRKKELAKKGLDIIKERRAANSDLGVNDFGYKEKMYKMEASLAEKDFLVKAFSGEVNNTINKAEETFKATDKAASNLSYRLKEGGKKFSPEDYEKIDAAWSDSAKAKKKLEELKKADKREMALDFAKSQFNRTKFYEQKSGIEGSILRKFNTLTGEDTIEKFEPTVIDKMGAVAAKMTNKEADPNGKPKDPEVDPNGKPKDPEADPSDSEKDKKKGFVAVVIEKIKKHGDGIKKFLLAGAIAVTAGILAYGGYKLATNQNTAVEQGMDKDNNGNTDGNVAEALEKHDASGETDGSENEKLNETVSYNVIVDGVEKTVELSNEVDTSAPEFTNPNRHLNDFGYMDMSKLKEMKEQGASEEAMGFEAMNMLNEALRNPHILANTGANLGVFGDIDSYEDVNEITNMIQNGDDESRAAIRHEVNEALAEFWSGATPKIGILKAGTPYESCFATQVGGDGNFQINIARDMNGVVHDHDVFYLYGEKDGQDIFNKNELGGIKEKMMKKLGVIKATDNADVRMAKMESGHCIVLEECSGQDGYVLDVKDVPVLHFNQEKTHVDVTPTNTPENTETNNDKPAPKNETSAPKPKNETPPAPTPNENPKTPETNVNDGKTNTASANEDDIKLGEVVKEAGFTNREGTNDLNVQTNLPGSEVTDKAQFDAMVKESIEQNSNPNTTWTFQDNSQGIVHQEGVATEKQADAENRSVLPPETRPEQSTPEGSVLAGDKTSTTEDKDGLMSAAKSDNTTAHESGQTRTVETSVSE